MCFSAPVSLGVFSVGMLCLLVMIYRKLYFYSVFYAFIIFMQLLEYYGHLALESGDTEKNQVVATFIFLLLFLQPVIFTLYAGFIAFKNKKFIQTILPILGLFAVISGFMYYQMKLNDELYITYLKDNCNPNFCRLDWSFFRSNILLSLLFLVFYFFLFLYSSYYFNLSRFMNSSFSILFTLLVLSLFYMITVDQVDNLNKIVTGFGSIWCILATLIGPYVLLFVK